VLTATRQVTLQARDLRDARAAFDASALVAPYLVALSAGSPIWRGMLAGIDARFPVLPPPPVLSGHAAFLNPY
jgi:gamma-glutamyl:cysteine ligase YbdK (ATP-grasp superfamily)